MQNTQTLQLFTEIIKAESFYKTYYNAEPNAWVRRSSGLINMGAEVRAL
jgi:hypothetical protein